MFVVLGEITGVYGLQGWIKLHSYTDPRDNIFRYNWLIGKEGDWQSVERTDGKPQGKTLIAKLKHISDRDQALALRGQQIGVSRDELPELGQDEFYWSDLQGMQVLNLDGVELGRVSSLFATGANDVMVVKGQHEHLIPFTLDEAVQKVSLEDREIIVDWDPEF